MTELHQAVSTVDPSLPRRQGRRGRARDRRSRDAIDRRGAARRGLRPVGRRGARGDGRARHRRDRAAARRWPPRWPSATCSSPRPPGRSATRRARKRASDAGARGATMPGVTAEMLGRVMAVDFDTMAARSRARWPALLESADIGAAHLSTGLGPDARPDRARRGRRRRQPHRAGRVREPPLRRGVHRPGERRGHDRRLEPVAARAEQGARRS